MPSAPTELLKLPADERAELAIALWESLSDVDREATMTLSPEEAAEIERRWREHEARPESGIPWEDVRRNLMDER